MPLFEAVWPDAPSSLISAYSVGEALLYLREGYGSTAIYQLDELLEIKPENFLLVRRCGRVLESPSYAYCPHSKARVFVVRSHPQPEQPPFEVSDREACVLVVDHVRELPTLLLWHFEYINEMECNDAGFVAERWQKHSQRFQVLEVDTTHPGLLLRYEYCTCSAPKVLVANPRRQRESDRD